MPEANQSVVPSERDVGDRRLVVLSNRVAVPSDNKPAAGGLAVGLSEALAKNGGLWLGWSGKVAEARSDLSHSKVGNIGYGVFDLTRTDIADYYNGFANRVLWPAFHFRLDQMHFLRRYLRSYVSVNEYVAGQVYKALEPDDVLWVHDYHFLMVGRYLRESGARQPIGFFLHIPFPPTEIAQTIPGHHQVFEGLLYYDLIGFQTTENADAFMAYAEKALGAERAGRGILRWRDRVVRVGAFPIGIDVENIEQAAARSAEAPNVKRVRDSVVEAELIISVDRLDYSKGIPDRLAAFDHFLHNYMGKEPRATLLQITPPSRTDVAEYRALREQIEAQSGRINAMHSAPDYVPIRHVTRTYARTTLAGLYRLARVGLVTPLRDGMNLVAKEYVAAQNPEDPGVLLLSRFAGAIEGMDGAIPVNPYDVEETAELIYKALVMARSERIERWASMMKGLRSGSAENWADSFVQAMLEMHRNRESRG